MAKKKPKMDMIQRARKWVRTGVSTGVGLAGFVVGAFPLVQRAAEAYNQSRLEPLTQSLPADYGLADTSKPDIKKLIVVGVVLPGLAGLMVWGLRRLAKRI